MVAELACRESVQPSAPEDDPHQRRGELVDGLDAGDVGGSVDRGGDDARIANDRGGPMTAKADFSDEQWDTVREGPTSAGLIVMAAERGGSFREAFAMAKVYAEARSEHGESELLDEIAAHRPGVDHTRAHSSEELQQHGLQRIREAVALVDEKATPEEGTAYRGFVTAVARRVAAAKQEKGSQDGVTEPEQQALDEIESALGGAS
jgi:hypothetical protein